MTFLLWVKLEHFGTNHAHFAANDRSIHPATEEGNITVMLTFAAAPLKTAAVNLRAVFL